MTIPPTHLSRRLHSTYVISALWACACGAPEAATDALLAQTDEELTRPLELSRARDWSAPPTRPREHAERPSPDTVIQRSQPAADVPGADIAAAPTAPSAQSAGGFDLGNSPYSDSSPLCHYLDRGIEDFLRGEVSRVDQR